MRILIIAIDRDVRSLSAFFHHKGQSAASCHRPEEATASLASVDYDAILISDRTGGPESILQFIQHLRAEGYAKLWIMIYGGSSNEAIASRWKDVGANAYIVEKDVARLYLQFMKTIGGFCLIQIGREKFWIQWYAFWKWYAFLRWPKWLRIRPG